jgi:hypothetical protein
MISLLADHDRPIPDCYETGCDGSRKMIGKTNLPFQESVKSKKVLLCR